MKKMTRFVSCLVLVLMGVSSLYAQHTVNGTVIDASSEEPLFGVTVLDLSTNSGVSTDIDGEFSITIQGDQTTLRISSVAYQTREITVTTEDDDIVIRLQQTVSNLDEVVVTGLATNIKRSNLANAVTSINAEDIADRTSPQTLDDALYGKISGVSIIAQSGAPGGGFNVQMRGVSTLGAGNSQPLYIIDGIWVNNSAIQTGRGQVTQATNTTSATQDDTPNRLADLNPDDIQSIEVLKGASAAAIYGQRANAGVVIIRTKSGAAGRTNISFQQDVGFSSALQFLGRTDWNEDRIRAFWGTGDRGDLEIQRFRDAQNSDRIRDLEKELYGENGTISKSTLSISGGDAKTRFFVSGTLNSEDGIIQNTGFDRRAIRANIEHSVSNRIRISSNSNYTFTDAERGFTGNQNVTGGSIGYTLAFTPNYAYNLLVNPDGTYNDNPYFAENPLRLRDVATNSQETSRFLQAVNIDADLYNNGPSSLRFNATGGFDIMNVNSIVHFPEFMQFQRTISNPGEVIHTNTDVTQTNLQGILIFNTTVGDEFNQFDLTTQAGYSRFTKEQNQEFLRGQGLAPGQINVNNANVQLLRQLFEEVTDIGWFGQQEVNWSDRLIATFGGRFDRSTLNLDQDEFTFYPKASLAVNLTNFDFWQTDLFDQFKLRAAYGETGGLPLFGNTFTPLNSVNIGGNLGGVQGTRTVDPNLKPERAIEIETGFDVSMFGGALNFEATYYNKKVEDLILDLIPSNATGVTAVATNAADLENEGVELTLGLIPIQKQNLNWRTRILWWTNTSTITELNIPDQFNQAFGAPVLGGVFIREGESPTAIGGQNENGELVKFGDFQPDFQVSFANEFNIYRNWELSFLWHWSEGSENINLSTLLTDSGGNTDDFFVGNTTEIVDRGPFITSQFIQDASYIKLREASLYYNVPQARLQRFLGNVVRGARFGVSGNNLLMISDYSGYDPEVSNFGTQATLQSVEVTPFPSTRRVLFHLKLDF